MRVDQGYKLRALILRGESGSIAVAFMKLKNGVRLFSGEFGEFLTRLFLYLRRHIVEIFFRFESGKDAVVGRLYRKRGKYARPFLHSMMMALLFFGFAFGPRIIRQSFAEEESAGVEYIASGDVLGVTSLNDTGLVTLESDKPRAQVEKYVVKDGDTLSSIAAKFDVTVDTVKWANPKIDWNKIKPGQEIEVPPVTGIVYKVRAGDTVHSIAKKYDTSAQAIVDFPFNTFSDDETFALVVGQTVIVPDGVMPSATTTSVPSNLANVLTPDAGSVSATGSFVWPAYGRITQRHSWYHPGIDIANNAGGAILAADSGRVITSGWVSSGYGYHVVIDHGNGYKTLYAHLSAISVVKGQSVSRGGVIGQMGSTGRSTGVHLHFEIIQGTGRVNALGFLQ